MPVFQRLVEAIIRNDSEIIMSGSGIVTGGVPKLEIVICNL